MTSSDGSTGARLVGLDRLCDRHGGGPRKHAFELLDQRQPLRRQIRPHQAVADLMVGRHADDLDIERNRTETISADSASDSSARRTFSST